MSGVIVVAGIFPPGSVVKLFEADAETALIPGATAEEVERRIVDDNGNVGFENLNVGGHYFVSGYVEGFPVDVRAVGTDIDAPDSELSQAPIGPETPVIGTQQEKVPDPPPAPPEEQLPVGVPEAALPALPAGSVPDEAAPEPEPAPAAESEVTIPPVADQPPVEPVIEPAPVPEPAPEVAQPEAVPAEVAPAVPDEAAPAPAEPPPAEPAQPAPGDTSGPAAEPPPSSDVAPAAAPEAAPEGADTQPPAP